MRGFSSCPNTLKKVQKAIFYNLRVAGKDFKLMKSRILKTKIEKYDMKIQNVFMSKIIKNENDTNFFSIFVVCIN